MKRLGRERRPAGALEQLQTALLAKRRTLRADRAPMVESIDGRSADR